VEKLGRILRKRTQTTQCNLHITEELLDYEKLPFLRSKISLCLNPKVRQCTEYGLIWRGGGNNGNGLFWTLSDLEGGSSGTKCSSKPPNLQPPTFAFSLSCARQTRTTLNQQASHFQFRPLFEAFWPGDLIWLWSYLILASGGQCASPGPTYPRHAR
jgi:hypothetical protein